MYNAKGRMRKEMSLVIQNEPPVNYVKQIIEMTPSKMNAEIARLALEGVRMSVINGKIGMMYGSSRRIYDFENNQVILRYLI